MTTQTRAVSLPSFAVVALAVGFFCAANANAQESSPWYVGVSEGFTHDSNVFRSPTGLQVGDSYSSTGLLGGLDLNPGRQHLFLDATAAANRFSNRKELNNTSYSLSSGLNWQTVEHLSGNIAEYAHRNLSQLSIPNGTQERNIETMRQTSANVRYGFASHLGLEGGVEHRKLDYTVTTEQNLSERSGHLGLRWGTPGSLLSLGLAGRYTKGDAPLYRALLDPSIPELGYGSVTPDTYSRKDIDLTATWTPSSASTIDARISLTREDHSAITRPDVHGVTGALTWDYRPTGRLAVKTAFIRDTGAQSVFFTSLETRFQPVEANTSHINNALSIDAKYQLTGKISLNATASINDMSLVNSSGGTGSSTSNRYALAASYAATRTLSFNCSYAHVGRADNVASCMGQFVLR